MRRRQFLATVGSAGTTLGLAPALLAQARPARIKVGQIGTTHAHAAGKLASLRKLGEHYEVVGVVEPDDRRWEAAQMDAAFQGLRRLTEEQLLNTPGLQAVAVETEVKDLLATAERCVRAGLHIHLDKPAGEKLSHFRRVLTEASRQQRTVQLGYMFRYNPGFQLCYRALAEGWLGRVFSVEAAMSKALSPAARKVQAEYRGGALFELGCHVLDAVIHVLGKPDRVQGFNRSSSTLNDGFLDNQYAVLEYPHATAVVHSALIEFNGEARRQFIVCGEQGTVEIRPLEPPKVRLALDRERPGFKRGSQELEMPRMTGRYDGEFLDLAAVIRGEKAFGWKPEHDLAVQETLLRACGLPVD